MSREKTLLVGDNPFQGVSHLSQERATSRGQDISDPNYAAELIIASVENGADGFIFTLNRRTLSILQVLNSRKASNQLQLYALIPDVNEFVRTVAFSGGVLGLATNLAKEIVFSRDWRAILSGLMGSIAVNPAALLRSYLFHEVCRLRSAAGRDARLVSLLLHETVCDMALALNMRWLFQEHMDFAESLGIKPGFETRNFPYLVRKLDEWEINSRGVVVAAPFNRIGFQMCPSRDQSEEALARIPEAEVIAFSVLAAGYLGLREALEYLANVPQLKGIAVGISKEQHAHELKLIKEVLKAKQQT